jgi:hypothetical protein
MPGDDADEFDLRGLLGQAGNPDMNLDTGTDTHLAKGQFFPLCQRPLRA